MMDFKLYICYAADGYNIEYFFNIMSDIDDGLQVIYMLRCRWLLYRVFCSTSCQILMMDFKLNICYAADGYYIEYFVQHHVIEYFFNIMSDIDCGLQVIYMYEEIATTTCTNV